MTAANIPRSAVVAACADMIRAFRLTLAELADELAKPVASQAAAAPTSAAPAPATPKRSGPALSQQAQQILEFAARPKGAIVKEIAFLLDVDYSTAAYHCDRLVGARLLTKVKARGEHAFRYWSNPAHALAYVEAKAQEFEQQLAAERQAEQQRQREAEQRAAAKAGSGRSAAKAAAPKPEKPAPAPKPPAPPPKAMTITPPKVDDTIVRPRGEAIKTDKTVETIDTTRRANNRLEAAPPLPPDPRYPSFSSMRPGVNPDTGKAWEARA